MAGSLRNLVYLALIAVLAAVAWLDLVAPITFITADLGRHIRNGELAVVQHHILDTNQYSYTHPDLPTICHHWGAGVIFYLVWRALGFVGLSMFYGGVLWLAIALFTGIAARVASFPAALLTTALALPLIATRVEIRPEGFSLLFLGLSFLLLYGHRARWFEGRWLWLIPLIHLIWVNTHILFGFGFVMLGIFVIDAVITGGFGPRFKQLALVSAAAAAISVVNPWGIVGVLEPLGMLKVHSYHVLAEDQSVFWSMQRFPAVFAYRLCVILAAASALILVVRVLLERSWRDAFLHSALLAFFSAMALRSVRSIPMFALFFIVLTAENWERIWAAVAVRWQPALRAVTAIAAAVVIVMSAALPQFLLSPLRRFRSPMPGAPAPTLLSILRQPQLWSGIAEGEDGAALFFKKAGLRGPVFNNYDIGGYFIFHFYPQERAFIDNRPEAYPIEFLTDVYGRMQAEDGVWAEMQQRYGLQAIFFYRRDMTEWGQRFLVRRVSDTEWAPVYVDANTLILAKRGGVNQAAIERHELPQSMFGVKRNR